MANEFQSDFKGRCVLCGRPPADHAGWTENPPTLRCERAVVNGGECMTSKSIEVQRQRSIETPNMLLVDVAGRAWMVDGEPVWATFDHAASSPLPPGLRWAGPLDRDNPRPVGQH